MFNFRLIVSAVALAVITQATSANEIAPPTEKSRPLTLGLVAGYLDKPYSALDDDAKRVVAPLILWEGERFFWRGGFGGYKFVNRPDLEVAALVSIRATMGYDSSDSNVLRGMDDRDATVDGGFHIVWKPSEFGLKFEMLGDLADEYGGYEVTGEGFYQARSGNWLNRFAAGLVYQSEDLVDYYYGVKNKEALPGRPAYSADAETNFRLSAATTYRPEGSKWSFLLGARYDMFGDEIDDSPITNDDSQLSVLAGFGYTFGI